MKQFAMVMLAFFFGPVACKKQSEAVPEAANLIRPKDKKVIVAPQDCKAYIEKHFLNAQAEVLKMKNVSPHSPASEVYYVKDKMSEKKFLVIADRSNQCSFKSADVTGSTIGTDVDVYSSCSEQLKSAFRLDGNKLDVKSITDAIHRDITSEMGLNFDSPRVIYLSTQTVGNLFVIKPKTCEIFAAIEINAAG